MCVAVGDGGASDAGSCFTTTVASSYKTCTGDADCVIKTHQLSCCGSLEAIGVSAAQAPAYSICETAWDNHFPACGCAAGPTVAEDGKAVMTLSMVAVHCVATPTGKLCMTSVP
jgi:hypothetical protein